MSTAERTVEYDLRQVLAQLELCSHVSAVNMDPSSRDAGEDIGGKRPPGGVDRREDHHVELGVRPAEQRILRSAEHFKQQLRRGRPKRRVLEDAQAAVAAWKRQPDPVDPEYGTPQWKRFISESEASDKELARKYSVSRQYIHRVRVQYRPVAP